jgi:large exoprotein involved in heme utilization and adhesion
VQAENLIATRGGQFISDTYGAGRGGNINLKITGLTEFSGDIVDDEDQVQTSGIKVISREYGGEGGNLELETGLLKLKEGAFLTAATEGQGQGGNLNIRTTDTITLSGLSREGYSSVIDANAYGKMENAGHGGTITLEARQLHLTDGALIGAITYGSGQGSNINFKIAESVSVTLSGEDDYQTSSIEASTLSSGEGGSIVLEANQLILKEGARLVANSEGTGRGGNIKIQVSDLVKFEGLDSYGSAAYVQANSNGKMANAGDAGTVELTAGRLHLSDGAQIGTSTFGPGQGGRLDVEVAKEAILSGQDNQGYRTGLFTSSQSTTDNPSHGGILVLKVGDLHITDKAEIYATTWGGGKGGNIDIQAQSINLASEGRISAYSKAKGDAGQITLTIGDRLQMQEGQIETSAKKADGGNITLTAPNYVYLIDSKITSNVNEDFGGGGNLTLKPNFIVLDGSQIFAKAKKGAGGNINTTGVYNFTGEPIGQIINASSEFGVDGEVTISTPDGNAVEGIFALPATFMDASGLIDTPCDQRVAENLSSLVLVQSEGSTNAAGDLFASGPLLVQIDKPVASSQKTQRTQTHRPLRLALLTGCQTHSKTAMNVRGDEADTQETHMIPEQLF